jgi:hypothetical protein
VGRRDQLLGRRRRRAPAQLDRAGAGRVPDGRPRLRRARTRLLRPGRGRRRRGDGRA